jgi:hypothetical protein
VRTPICPRCGTVQPARRTLQPGQLGAGIVTAVVVLIVGGVIASNIWASKAQSDQMLGMLNKGETMAMSADATNVATMLTDATTGTPVQPFTATKTHPATIDGQTYTPSGANQVTLTPTATGFCITVTNPGVKTPVTYDSGTGSTTATTPGICG